MNSTKIPTNEIHGLIASQRLMGLQESLIPSISLHRWETVVQIGQATKIQQRSLGKKLTGQFIVT